MKKITFLLLSLFSLFFINSTNAQIEINSFETTQIDSTSQEERETLFLYRNYPDKFYNNPDLNTTKKYKFTVFLKDNNSIDVKSQIFFSENKHFILYGNRKIYPDETNGITARFDEYEFNGIPNDSCWLFRTNDDNDPIYTYSILPENKNRFIVFAEFQKSNLQPLTITKENVMNLVQKYDIALEYAQKNKLITAIKQYNIKHYIYYK